MSRIRQIQALLDHEPDDVFLNFGLAMELAAAGQTDEALAHYDRVLELDRDYVSAYLRKGDLLVRLRRDDEARETLLAGVETANRVNDAHMREKMQELLDRLR